MYKALWTMKHTKGHSMSSRQFEQLRASYAEAVSKFWKGRHLSPSHHANFLIGREKAKASGVVYGGMHSEEHRLIMIESNKSRKGIKLKKQPGKSAGSKNPRAKFWLLQNEDGSTFTSASIRPWCIENGMVQNSLVVKSAKGQFYKGWKILSSAPKE